MTYFLTFINKMKCQSGNLTAKFSFFSHKFSAVTKVNRVGIEKCNSETVQAGNDPVAGHIDLFFGNNQWRSDTECTGPEQERVGN
jgi:hypothetical protein